MAEVQLLVTAGNHDPAGPPVHQNNVWIVGDAAEVVVIDPAHDARAVADAVAGRRVVAVICTHGHWDHVRSAVEFTSLVGVDSVNLAEADRFLWEAEHGQTPFTPLQHGQEFDVAGITLTALATPGHTPGSTSLAAPALGCVFTGDTLFEGGPGATRWDYSSFETILDSIETHLLVLPAETDVHTGHGPSTRIGTEATSLEEWRARGW